MNEEILQRIAELEAVKKQWLHLANRDHCQKQTTCVILTTQDIQFYNDVIISIRESLIEADKADAAIFELQRLIQK